MRPIVNYTFTMRRTSHTVRIPFLAALIAVPLVLIWGVYAVVSVFSEKTVPSTVAVP